MAELQRGKRFGWLRDIAIVLVVWGAIRTYQMRDLPSGRAPELMGLGTDGAELALENYRGRPVLLHFWATWCGVCRAEQGSIDSVAEDWPVLSVASQSGGPAEVAAYVARHGMKPAVVMDPSSELARRFGVSAFPTTFVIDAEGDIRFREVGYTTELGMRARLWLAGL